MKAGIITRCFLVVMLLFSASCSDSDDEKSNHGESTNSNSDSEDKVDLVESQFIINGGFEEPLLVAGEWTFISSNNAAGWKVTWADTSDSIGNLEIKNNVSGLGGAYEGEQHAELGSHGRLASEDNSIRIFQDMEPCPGPVLIEYAWRPRPQQDSQIEVYWNNDRIAQHSSIDGEWVLETVEKTVAEGEGVIRIEFIEVGPADLAGMFLDAVSVVGLTGCA